MIEEIFETKFSSPFFFVREDGSVGEHCEELIFRSTATIERYGAIFKTRELAEQAAEVVKQSLTARREREERARKERDERAGF